MSLRTGLVKKYRVLWHISKLFLFHSPCWKHERIFFQYCNIVNFTILCGLLYERVHLEFLTLTLIFTEPPAMCKFFTSLALVPMAFSMRESLLKETVTPCIHLSVSIILGAVTYLVYSPFLQIQEELIFCLFICLLVFKMEWRFQAPYK